MKNLNKLSFWFAPFLVFILGCSSNLKPFSSKNQIKNLSYDEKLIWHKSNEFEKSANEGQYIYKNSELENYLQQITNKLFPDYKDHLRVKVLHSPSYNAFALPNGALYINIGLLAALENEAQVASILSHEGIHFIQKHGARQYQSAQTSKTN